MFAFRRQNCQTFQQTLREKNPTIKIHLNEPWAIMKRSDSNQAGSECNNVDCVGRNETRPNISELQKLKICLSMLLNYVRFVDWRILKKWNLQIFGGEDFINFPLVECDTFIELTIKSRIFLNSALFLLSNALSYILWLQLFTLCMFLL